MENNFDFSAKRFKIIFWHKVLIFELIFKLFGAGLEGKRVA